MQFWTYLHFITYIPSLLFMIVCAGILRKLLLKRDEKIRLIPIQILAVLLVLIEIGKQALSIKKGYDLYHLPFHFCSMFIFFIPLSAFCRGKLKRFLLSFTTYISSTLFLFMLVCPAYTYSETRIANFFSDYFSFHTVIFHDIAIFVFLLIVALDIYQPDTKFDLKSAFISLAVFCLIGAVMSQIFETNYNNFYSCSAEVVDNVRLAMIDSLGYAAGQTIYVLGVSAVNLLFSCASYFIYRLLCGLLGAFKHKNRTLY